MMSLNVFRKWSAVEFNQDRSDSFWYTAVRLKAVNMSIGMMAAGSNIKFSDAVKLLGVNFDRCLTMDSYVASVVRSCNIRALRHI